MKIQFMVHETPNGEQIWVDLKSYPEVRWCSAGEQPLDMTEDNGLAVLNSLTSASYNYDEKRLRIVEGK
jgi:hypothetical protein